MEEKKKMSAFDVVNAAILAVGFAFAVSAFFQRPPAEDMLCAEEYRILDMLTKIVSAGGLFCGTWYMAARYTKKAAILYKAFMYCFVAYNALFVLDIITIGSELLIESVSVVACLLFGVVMAAAKDLGKTKTFIVVALVLIANMVILGIAVQKETVTLFMVGNFILALEVCIMVSAKYRDKESRGAA